MGRRYPDWLVPVGLLAVVLVLVGALYAVGDGQDEDSHRSEVFAAKQMIDEVPKWVRYGGEGRQLVLKGEDECEEAAYLCDGPARWNVERGEEKQRVSAGQLRGIRNALDQLDPAAVEEARR